MQVGLKIAPVSFQLGVDINLTKYKWIIRLLYIDYIITFPKDVEGHTYDVDKILIPLGEVGMAQNCNSL